MDGMGEGWNDEEGRVERKIYDHLSSIRVIMGRPAFNPEARRFVEEKLREIVEAPPVASILRRAYDRTEEKIV